MPANPNPRNGFPEPTWWSTCKQVLMAGSTQAIILHLNTRDYAVPGKSITTYLSKVLATRDVVAIMPAPLTGPRIKVDLLDLNGEWLVVFADDPPHPVTQAAGLPEPESHHP